MHSQTQYPATAAFGATAVDVTSDERLSAIKQFDHALARLVENISGLEARLSPVARQMGPEPAPEKPSGLTEIERLIDQLDMQATRVGQLADRVVVR